MATKPGPEPTELPPAKLRWRCELSRIPFETTAQAEPREGFIGQERALRALKMGVGLAAPGYNVFVCGLAGASRGGGVAREIGGAQPAGKAPVGRALRDQFQDGGRPRPVAAPRGEAEGVN